MANGKTVKYNARKKLHWLLLLWAAFLGSIGIIAVLFLVNVPDSVKWLGTLIALIMSLIMVFYCKPYINYYDMHHRYELLLATNIGTVETNCQFNQDWIEQFSIKGYQMHVDNELFQIWYRFKKSLARKTFIKTQLIEIVTIIKNKSIDLYDSRIEKEYKKLWQRFEKEQHLNKQIILQFKKLDDLDDKVKEDLNRIISYREGDNYLISINCGYYPQTNEVYYLHSSKFAPNAYYRYAVSQIEDIIRE